MDKEQWVNTNVDHFLPDTETWKERLKETDKEYAVIKDKIIHTLSNINAYLRDNWDDIYTCAKDIKFATFVNYQYPYIASVYGDEERIVFDNFILTKQGIKNINYDYIIDDILTFQGKDVIKSKVITAVINSIRCICDMHGRITNIRNSTKKAQEK